MKLRTDIIKVRNGEGQFTPLQNVMIGEQDLVSVDKVIGLPKVAQTGKYSDLIGAPDPNDLIIDAGIEVGTKEPERTSIDVWIDTNQGQTTYRIPEVKDNLINEQDTWSSSKIQKMIFETVYPIGKIIYTTRADNPSTYLGGLWRQIKDVFLLAAGNNYNAGSTGGEAEHILTIEELPSHAHGLGYNNYKNTTAGATTDTSLVRPSKFTYSFTDETGTLAIGNSQPHNNMPPYKVVYVWERISESAIITFSIDGKTYEAFTGMTWFDWCNSEYNLDNWIIDEEDRVFDADNFITFNGERVLGSEQIIADTDYSVVYDNIQ